MGLSDTQRTTLEVEVAALIDVLMANYAIGDSDEPVLAAAGVTGYTRQLHRLAETAGQCGFTTLQLGCAQLERQLEGFDRTANDADLATVDEELRDLLETWPTLVMGCLESPDETADTLIEVLQAPGWPTPATPDAIARIADSDRPSDAAPPEPEAPSETVFESEPVTLDDDPAAPIDVEETSDPATLSELLADYPNPIHEENLDVFADWLEIVANAAAAEEQFGLHDLAHLLREQVQALESPIPDDTCRALAAWPPLVNRFLAESGSPQAAEALLDHLLQPTWPIPLADDDTAVLLELLTPVLPDPTESEPEPPPAEPLPAFVETLIERSAAYSPDVSPAITTEDEPPPEPVIDEMPEEPPAAAVPGDEPEPAEPVIDEMPEEPPAAAVSGDEPEPAEPVFDEMPEEPPAAAVSEHEAEPTEPMPESVEMAMDSAESVISPDLLEILMAELAEINDSAGEAIEIARNNPSTEARAQALVGFGEEIGRLRMAADSIGLDGLGQYCGLLQTNLALLAEREQALSPVESDLLASWIEPTLEYLHNPVDRNIAGRLVDPFTRSDWPQSLDVEAATLLVDALVNPSPVLAEFGEIEERPQEALPEDVSLQLPGDTHPELLDGLLQELPNQVAEFSALVQCLYSREGSLGDIDTAQRIAHTLKGAGNTVGIAGIANLTHHTEDILIALGKERTLPNRALAKTLMDVADCLETMCEALTGMGSPPAHAREVLQSVLDWANRIDHEGVPAADAEPPPVATVSRPATYEEDAAETTAEAVPAAATRETGETARQSSMIRVPAKLVDEQLRLVGESILIAGQIEERVRGTLAQARQVRAQHQLIRRLVGELEQLVDVQGVGMPAYAASAGSDFDPLEMDQYNELHTVTRRLIEAAADAQALDESMNTNFGALDELLVEQAQTHRNNQEAVLHSRMLPIRTIVPRLHRVVRQTCRLTDKETELRVEGEDTLIESVVLNEIIDPLMHLLRNAIDHGIESAEQRIAQGKPASGRLRLSFAREGNSILVRCRDDGRGLDLEAIRRNAEQRGLITPEQRLGDDELSRLILQPGFSTRSQATQVSGRGIGMDIVYSQILKLKGGVSLNSQPGHGTTIELRLPVTLIATHALLIQQGTQVFAVAERGVDQILHSSSGQLVTTDGKPGYRIGTEHYELDRLEELLGLGASLIPTETRPLLLIRDETDTLRAVMADAVLGSRDLVVKSMGRLAPRVHGILGATILGDGSVTPVLDLPELLRNPQLQQTLSTTPAESVSARQRSVLIVDDSLSVRRAMQQLMSDAGFETRLARDGLEAVAQLNESRPDLLLVDLEMPRMNGLELTYHVRSQESTRDLPVIMITSRSTEKHREEAHKAGVSSYLTKPVADHELLDHVNQAIAS